MKRLIIVRHGNTFLPEQTPTRVGRGTDLPLVEEGRGRAIGKYLLSKGLMPDKVCAAPLQRTMQTAQLALDAMHLSLPIVPIEDFVEIDYGPDENKTEAEVQMRLGRAYADANNMPNSSDDDLLLYGKEIINRWDTDGTVPDGWSVDIDAIINTWKTFSASIEEGETVFLCSSNGIIRFAPYILNMPYEEFCKQHNIKVATGSVSVFENLDGTWVCKEWGTKVHKLF